MAELTAGVHGPNRVEIFLGEVFGGGVPFVAVSDDVFETIFDHFMVAVLQRWQQFTVENQAPDGGFEEHTRRAIIIGFQVADFAIVLFTTECDTTHPHTNGGLDVDHPFIKGQQGFVAVGKDFAGTLGVVTDDC